MDQWNHLVAIVRQDVIGFWKAIGQEITQEASFVTQQWDRLLGINPNAQNPSFNTAVPQHRSGSNTGYSAPTAVIPHAPSPSLRATPMTSQPDTPPPPRDTVSGTVWLDSNEDGIEDNGETGMPGITVDLVTPDNVTVASTTTDANGDYLLAADPTLSNQYEVQVIIPEGYSATNPTVGMFGTPPYSSINYNGLFNIFDLPASGGISNINTGLCSGTGPLASISGKVWLDSNDSGIMENGEPGLQSITVYLYLSDNLMGITSTDDNGDYSFMGLPPSPYYWVAFFAPHGYVFSPQSVGPPSTSSSAGPYGVTNTIELSPGQNDTTVNAGLYGSAPIVSEANDDAVYMTAENDSYTGMDLTADGYDPNGAPLTPVITQAPTYGSLVYDTSTGLYDYTAPTGFTGEDSFQYELSNGHAVSNVVTVNVLAYNGIVPSEYDNFPALGGALYTATTNVPQGNAPDPSSVKQGSLDDCWFLAAADGLAQQNPNAIVNMIHYNAGPNTYTVNFGSGPLPFGKTSALITSPVGDGHSYSTANGDWLAVLEKAYGQMVFNQAAAANLWSVPAYSYINRDGLPSAGVEALTGHSTDVDWFWSTRISVTRQKLINAFANDKVVTAQIFYGNQQMAEQNGLVNGHVYTVVAYDATTDEVRLYNPHHGNPEYDPGSGLTYRGQNDADNLDSNGKPLPPPGNGYFWMSLSEFTTKFSAICYEE